MGFFEDELKKSRNPLKPAISAFENRLEQTPREKTAPSDKGNNQSCRQQRKTHSPKAGLGQGRLLRTQF